MLRVARPVGHVLTDIEGTVLNFNCVGGVALTRRTESLRRFVSLPERNVTITMQSLVVREKIIDEEVISCLVRLGLPTGRIYSKEDIRVSLPKPADKTPCSFKDFSKIAEDLGVSGEDASRLVLNLEDYTPGGKFLEDPTNEENVFGLMIDKEAGWLNRVAVPFPLPGGTNIRASLYIPALRGAICIEKELQMFNSLYDAILAIIENKISLPEGNLDVAVAVQIAGTRWVHIRTARLLKEFLASYRYVIEADTADIPQALLDWEKNGAPPQDFFFYAGEALSDVFAG